MAEEARNEIVKSHHAKLRSRLKGLVSMKCSELVCRRGFRGGKKTAHSNTQHAELGEGCWEQVWAENLADQSGLQKYAEAMHALATDEWRATEQHQSRVVW
jgi:hypothetical protein